MTQDADPDDAAKKPAAETEANAESGSATASDSDSATESGSDADADADPDTESEPSPGRRRKPKATARGKYMLFTIIAVLSLIADQGTKIWARGSLPVASVHGPTGVGACTIPDDIVTGLCTGVRVPVIDGYWEWRLSMNTGSAFGLFSSIGPVAARILLSVVGLAALLGMIYMLKRSRNNQRVMHWALALAAGGAIGNLIDRMYFGVVTDFVLWRYQDHEWPVFNVADVVLVAGVILMFFVPSDKKKRKRPKLAAPLTKP